MLVHILGTTEVSTARVAISLTAMECKLVINMPLF